MSVSEDRQIAFAKKLAKSTAKTYEGTLATVKLLYMDGKLDEALIRYEKDPADFYAWANAVLIIIHFKLNT